jgi:AraC-like DNA-binding protein
MTNRSKDMTAGCRTAGALAVRALMDFAVLRGCSLAMLAERSGIETAELRDAENRIAFPKYVALMKAAQEMCNDPAFGLHFGESDEGMEATFACMMGIFSPTMGESLAQIDGENDRLQMTRNEDQLWIVETWNDDFPEGAEARFARVVCAARRLFPGPELIKAVHFTHAEPPYRAEYDRVFRMPIAFGMDRNGVLMDAAWLDQRPERPSGRLLEIVKARAATLRSTRNRVEAVLMNALPAGGVNIDAVAGKLAMGRHTLFRKLRAEGVSFTQVVSELRQKLAGQYLGERKLGVNETAYLLGFSDPTAFSRAYKRWTGHSPRQPR